MIKDITATAVYNTTLNMVNSFHVSEDNNENITTC